MHDCFMILTSEIFTKICIRALSVVQTIISFIHFFECIFVIRQFIECIEKSFPPFANVLLDGPNAY